MDIVKKLILPKQTSKINSFVATLKILYTAYQHGYPEVTNKQYKKAIVNEIEVFHDDDDSAKLVKQSELVRYFGFAEGDFQKKEIRITDKGIKLYENYLANGNVIDKNLVVDAILTLTYGRFNTAIKESDSDIDAPKLFVKSIQHLDGITKDEFAKMLYFTHDLSICFESAIEQIRYTRNGCKDIVLPNEVRNKYGDTKFPAFLEAIGICEKNDKKYRLSKDVSNLYSVLFTNINIYNTKPTVLIELKQDIDVDITDEEIDLTAYYKKEVTQTLPYDTNSDLFTEQNNRKPIKKSMNKMATRYPTNPRIGKTAMRLAEYKCENDELHTTFLSKSQVPFMEPHHLIPMVAQKDFEYNLDCVENIVSLCPNCHSAIHYGDAQVRKSVLMKLYSERVEQLVERKLEIGLDDLFEKYYR